MRVLQALLCLEASSLRVGEDAVWGPDSRLLLGWEDWGADGLPGVREGSDPVSRLCCSVLTPVDSGASVSKAFPNVGSRLPGVSLSGD